MPPTPLECFRLKEFCVEGAGAQGHGLERGTARATAAEGGGFGAFAARLVHPFGHHRCDHGGCGLGVDDAGVFIEALHLGVFGRGPGGDGCLGLSSALSVTFILRRILAVESLHVTSLIQSSSSANFRCARSFLFRVVCCQKDGQRVDPQRAAGKCAQTSWHQPTSSLTVLSQHQHLSQRVDEVDW